MKLTSAQQAAVEHRGSSLLVCASAGAGKTEVLARRCAALVADEQQPCAVDRLLVVTFTRAAAAELRLRVARLLRAAATQARTEALRRHLRRQELLIDAADIGTIDAWCGRIVREHSADAGVDVRFAVLGEEQALLLRAATLDELFDWVHRGGEPLADRAREWISRAAAPGDRFLRVLVERLNRWREHLVNPQAWFERQRAACRADDAERVLAAALAVECRFQQQQVAALRANLPPEVNETLAPYEAALTEWGTRLAANGTLAAVVAALAAFKLPAPRGRNTPPEHPALHEVRQRWLEGRLKKPWAPEAVGEILRHAPATADLVLTVLDLEERYAQLLSAAKQQRAALEFGDVLRATLDLLGRPTAGPRRGPTDIARRLQRRYEHVLVDEYQDTSPVQVEILRLVSRDGPGRTNRFLVGDLKQSIYGFREAEPRLFAELQADFNAGRQEGRVLPLSDNFRSHATLLDGLNELFTRLFDPLLGGTPYGPQERLIAGRRADEIANPTLDGHSRIEVCILEEQPRDSEVETDDDELLVERIEREAQVAAEQIRALLAAGVQVPQRGKDGTASLRPLRLADIVILLRSAAVAAPRVARVLRNNGVPAEAVGRESPLNAVEVRDVECVLRLLVNRRQDVPLAAYLRSPLVGLSAGELLTVRTQTPRAAGGFYEAVDAFRTQRPVKSLAVKLDGALAQLNRWTEAAREEELPALLRRVFADSGLLLLAAAQPGGAQRVALLRMMERLAADYSRTGPGGLDGFVDYLESLAEEEITPAATAAGPADVVRILTIHGAKGLEFPVVFVLGAGNRFHPGRQRQAWQMDEDLGFGLRFDDYRRRATLTSARLHVIARRAAHRELEEEMRLLYVAATRARERLVVIGHAPPDLWPTCRERFGPPAAAPPLLSRLAARHRLEWVLMAAAGCAGNDPTAADAIRVSTRPATGIRVAEPAGQPQTAEEDVPTPEVAGWVTRGRALLTADIGTTDVHRPAVLSVSAFKELALRARGEDRPHVLDEAAEPLPRPAFAADSRPSGQDLGTACHRFLEWADLGCLTAAADVAAQVAGLQAAGRLSDAEAALVPVNDIVWLAGTPVGRLLAEHAATARRELPFVYAGPPPASADRSIIRGVIDCVLDTPNGLIVIDYKTDRPRDDDDLEERLAGYRAQLRLYAEAAGAILARPVARAILVLLRARRIEDVALAPPPAESGA